MNDASTLVTKRSDRSFTATDRVARSLGWFSLGLGLAEMIAPGKLGRALGLEGKEGLLRAYGGREIGAGIWALSDTPGPALWARFAGDLVDLGTLAVGLRGADDQQKRNATIALAAVAGITAVDLLTAMKITSERSTQKGQTGRDYSDRSGFPGGVDGAKGAARKDFKTPPNYRAAPVEEPKRQSAELEPA